MKDSLSGEVVRYSACDLFCVENLRKSQVGLHNECDYFECLFFHSYKNFS